MEIEESKSQVKTSWFSRHHMLLMVLCCLAPIVGILALRAIGIQNSFLNYAVALICPISMVLMMAGMTIGSKRGGGHHH